MHKTMQVYGVDRRLDRRVKCHWTHSTLAIAWVCALHPFLTVWFHSILAMSVGGLLFIVHTACYHTPLSLVCTLSRRVTGTWALHWTPEKKSTKGSTFRQKLASLQPLLRLMTMVFISVGVRNKWPSETHYTSARFGEWSDTAPDYQVHHLYWSGVALSQMSARELYQN